MSRHLLSASATALGYIAGNTRGAYIGNRLASRYNKMAPMRYRGLGKRKRTNKSVGYGGTKRRQYAGSYTAAGVSNSAKNSRRKARASRRQGGSRSNPDSSGYRKTFKKKRGSARAMRAFKKILAPQVVNSVTQGSIQSATARQTVTLVNLTNTNSTSTGDGYLMSFADLSELARVTSAFDPNNTAAIVGGNSSFNTRRLMVNSVTTCVTMKNMSNVPLTITLYDVSPRKDGGGVGVTPYDGFSPTAAWRNGLIDQAVGQDLGLNQNALFETFPGATPYQSQRFCQTWIIRRKTKFMLHPGSNHKHYIKLKPAHMFNVAGFASQAWMRYITTALMAVVEGGVVHQTGGPLPASGPVTLSPGLLDYVTETQYKFTAMEKSRTAYVQYTDLNTLGSGTQATIVEDTDTVGNYAQVVAVPP